MWRPFLLPYPFAAVYCDTSATLDDVSFNHLQKEQAQLDFPFQKQLLFTRFASNKKLSFKFGLCIIIILLHSNVTVLTSALT